MVIRSHDSVHKDSNAEQTVCSGRYAINVFFYDLHISFHEITSLAIDGSKIREKRIGREEEVDEAVLQ